ncbi:TRAP transporter small permease [Pontibacterium granulatum]|uniref:TRAP transporter small permease n=1 Tax=Pontibacterium granulatum TaxID=2036029 RepID=UPI00249BDBDE|nr:TRAP transporter small permease [Pontibacterium granulatum]MDI3325777.1 TRAP transporter small permease [Pontibacterium granulatum]
MLRFFSNLDHFSNRALKALAVVSSIAVVVLMLFLVVARYILGWSVVGVMELVIIAGMWLYMSGAMIASHQNEHLVVDFLYQQLQSDRARAIHQMLIGLGTAVICIFFMVWSWKMLAWGMKRPQTTPGLSIPLWLPQASIMLASVTCFAYAVRDTLRSISQLKSGKDS